jgi:glycosyltransferase involved in cell wall biosynthesis
MKKIKILLIGMSSNLGGIETYLYNLVKNADLNLFQFDFLYSEFDTMAMENDLKKIGCNIYKITPRFINYQKHIKELKKIYKNNYDYIHYSVMSFSWFEPIVIANKYSNAKIIIHSHNGGFGKNASFKTRLLHKIGKLKIKKVPYLRVACGQKAGKFMFNGNSFTIFNNGIDIDKFKFNKDNRIEIRKELNISDNTTIVGIVAKLEKQKNPLFLVDIFNEYQKLNGNSKLLLIGEGSLEDKMLDKIKKYNIEEKVLFLGKKINVNKYLSSFDIFIMPSLFEGLSISLIEAQVNGLKCYTSSRVDKNSNITGNVEFLSLNKCAGYWANYIFNSNNDRDMNVLDKIPDKFNSKKSYEKVYQFYMDNLI